MDRREYRVRWRRENMNGATQIYQTEKGAVAKADRLRKLDAEIAAGEHQGRDDWDSPFKEIPPIAEGPSIEVRDVGEWKLVEEASGG